MDKIEKALKRLSVKEREVIKKILGQLLGGSFANLDIKKLRGRNDVFRVRKGNLRIIYRVASDHRIFILTIERRSDHTYDF